jgi:hypothetical protein
MGLGTQWEGIAAGLPEGWAEVQLALALDRPETANRASVLLGAIGPGRVDNGLRLRIASADGAPALLRRLLARLDAEGISGVLSVAETQEAAAPVQGGTHRERDRALASQWDGLAAALPQDWSDLLCALELGSTDDLPTAALAIAPLNPSREKPSPALRFRVARRYGYGAAPEMARRCLARLDEQGIPGRLRLVDELSDTRPVATQGPTFVVGNRAV